MKGQMRLNLLIILPTVVIGIIGGLTGAFFIFWHLKVARFRRKMLSKISSPEVLNALKVFEPMFVAVSVLNCTLHIQTSELHLTCKYILRCALKAVSYS